MKTILVVDDEDHIRMLYESALREEGYDVALAKTGREALQKFVTRRPDLLILDIRMPGMDGLEVLAGVLAEDRRVPVVVSSAYSSYKDSFLTWSADAYIVKSSDLTELLETVRELL